MLRAVLVLCILTGCSDFPEVGAAEARLKSTGATPRLLTGEELAALSAATPNRSPALATEAAALQARAKRLRQR